MIDFSDCYRDLQGTALKRWLPILQNKITALLNPNRHGHLHEWLEFLDSFPKIVPDEIDLSTNVLKIGAADQLKANEKEELERQLKLFMPWRKGPIDLFGIAIDTEWRSDLKWSRLESAISPLENRTVLDVGCSNGYHCFRMHAAGAKLVIGVEPMLRYLFQFQILRHFIAKPMAVHVLPMSLESLPEYIPAFDSVFSMGVLYHRKSPIDHLYDLKKYLRPGGELVLETLVIDDDYASVLVPEDRYAKMRNVWFIPSCRMLETWLTRVGFINIQCIDISTTSVSEQRATDWMQLESLVDFLDPNDLSLTIESYPAPKRAIFIASKSGG